MDTEKEIKALQDRVYRLELMLAQKTGSAKKEPKFSPADEALAKEMAEDLKNRFPADRPQIGQWAQQIRLMREVDKLEHYQIADMWIWAAQDKFWSPNIRSPKKLRQKWANLDAKRRSGGGNARSDREFRLSIQDTSWTGGDHQPALRRDEDHLR